MTFAFIGIGLPILVWGVANIWMNYLAAVESDPNQGAMALAFLVLCVSIVIGAAMLGYGMTLFIQSRKMKD